MTKHNTGDSIIILGNGPSLRADHFELIKGKKALGMNAAYRYWDRINWYPEIYCCLDNQVVISHADRIRALIDEGKCKTFFLATDILEKFPGLSTFPNVYFLPQLRPGPLNQGRCEKLGIVHRPSKFFGTDYPSKLTTGSYSARFAAEMGYRKIGLIGIDCRYVEVIEQAKSEEGIALSMAETPKHNPNYFFDDYQQAGDRYNVPNPAVHNGNLHLQALEALRDDFAKRKFEVQIINCAITSELFDKKVFPFQNIESFLDTPRLSAIFVPFVERDLPRILKNLEKWGQSDLSPCKDGKTEPSVELHFAFNGFKSPSIEKDIEAQFSASGLQRSFSALKFHYSELEGLRDLYTRNFSGEFGPEGYMAGPNNQFFDIITKFSAGMSHIQIMEADVTPVQHGWLSRIQELCSSSEPFWICGSHYRGSGAVKALWHVNGNAIYNVGDSRFQEFFRQDFLSYFYERVRKTPSLAYDIVIYDMLKNALDASTDNKPLTEIWKKIAHRIRFSEHIVDLSHKDDFLPENMRDVRGVREAFPEAVLAHGAVAEKEKAKAAAKMIPKTVNRQVLFIEPDGIDSNGHYFSYAARLGEAARSANLHFGVLGRKGANTDALPEGIRFEPCISIHSWSMGNRQDGQKSPLSEQFIRELSEGLSESRPENYEATQLYLYYGSLEHARSIRELLTSFPETVSATVNLFWSSFVDRYNTRYINRWRPDVWAMADDPRINLTAPTEQVADDIEHAFGIRLPVAPHPSPTFTDDKTRQFANMGRRAKPGAKTVLFPGGMRMEKGFDLTAAAAISLAGNKNFNIVVRAAEVSSTSQTKALARDIEAAGVKLDSSHMSDEAFAAFLATADIIVCPYRQSHFAKRTSGLIVDALALGLPVVALKETWLGEYIERLGIGVQADPTAASIIEAIESIAQNYEAFSAAISESRKNYLDTDGWEALIHSLSETTTEQKSVTPALAVAPVDEAAVVAELPPYLRASIFLPTDRIPPLVRVDGLKKIRDLYNGNLLDERYRPDLRDIKASRKSRRCFIIGNGPSLKITDLGKLKDEVTFATNGFFLKLPDLDWAPTYYVVEDHLVAEDRSKEINRLRGPIKLFPANLRYVIEPDDKTIFFDHRPRVSFPHGFDFSFDADKFTYAGGTVTYTCIQLAAYLGYEEIYLIGVDADYAIPKDAEISGPGRVKEIDMQSDDPNHFHPDYFGKGKRWHEPNVDVMLQAYAEARRATEARGVTIRNATIGGKLEVFQRADFNSLFPPKNYRPRLLLIDMTRVGDGSATGEVKANLFAGWPSDRLAQIYDAGTGKVGLKTAEGSTAYASPANNDKAAIAAAIAKFSPDVVLYRPTPKTNALHNVAMHLVRQLNKPVVCWIMDDWPTAFATEDAEKAAALDADFRFLLQCSSVRLSICDEMSTAFGERYATGFTAIANGVTRSEWPVAKPRPVTGPFKVRYAGSLAENMSQASVKLVAEAVEALSREGIDITFEIKTRELWKNLAAAKFEGLSRTSFIVADLSAADYRAWLSSADAVVIGYNFDKASITYTRYSLANKLPECLASGAPLVAIGPAEGATIATLNRYDCGIRITKCDPAEITRALSELIASDQYRFELAQKAQQVAFDKFDLSKARTRLVAEISAAAALPPGSDVTGLPRSTGAHLDETAAVAWLLAKRQGVGHVMLDIGAHVGSSAGYFDELGWTVHCFEPDPVNRNILTAAFGQSARVTIDSRAVSDKPAKGLQFFTSKESTGISGLHAFRETHTATTTVDATTVAEIVRDRKIRKVDFLKIDVEGFDLNVLKGVPWDTLTPDVVECEFEDAKTLRLGHDWRHVADYLEARGYTVYVSEWHPIVRYGIPHDWRRVFRYPGPEMDSSAWGNFLAFREDPGISAVRAAFDACMKFRSPSKASAQAPKKKKPTAPAATKSPSSAANARTNTPNVNEVVAKVPSHPTENDNRVNMLKKTPPNALEATPPTRMWYSEPAERLRQASPQLFTLLQFARRSFVHVISRPHLLILLLSVVAGASWVSLDTQFAANRGWLLAGGGFALVTLGLIYVAAKAQVHAATLHVRAANLERELFALKDTAARTQQLVTLNSHSRTDAISARISQLQSELALARAANAKLTSDFSNLMSDLSKLSASATAAQTLKAEVTNLSAAVQAIPKSLEPKIQESKDAAHKLTNELAARIADLAKQLEAGKTTDASLQTSIKDLQAGVKALQDQRAGIESAVANASTKVQSAEDRLATTEKWSRFDNAAWFQHFNRKLSRQHVEVLDKEWRKRLSVPMQPATLGYMANRACEIERQLEGRLATSIEDILLRALVARAVKGKSVDVLEIGTLFGTGAAIMFDALEGHYAQIHFTLLDPLEGYYNGAQADILTGQRVNEHVVRKNLARVGISEDQYTLIKHLSTEPEAMQKAAGRKYDVLVIDGDHSYAGVKTDFENYAPLVRVGGYIILDDYNSPDWPDVKEYVDKELDKHDFIAPVGATWRTSVYRVVKDPAKTGRSQTSSARKKSPPRPEPDDTQTSDE